MTPTPPVAKKKTRQPRKTAAKKKTGKKASQPRARKTSEPKPAVPSPATPPTDEQIRMRAYFLGERRAQEGLPGNSDQDWLEARRQLFAEAGIPPE